ncbi:hypothetical protein Tco_1221045 [Tanacetum coccineum]
MEQWRDSYGNGDYDDDLYDDDMYEGQDLSHELQAICENLDIRVSKFSKQNVYSTKAILGVKYGHLEEIVVKISDQRLYKFKEGDFIYLHLNDIEDMLLLAV